MPWAHEPRCQSCHTGDALANLAGAPDTVAAPDGIRLLQAWRVGDPAARPITAPTSRFAENEPLYRLSKGHGGIFCEGCHGNHHAEWPVVNPLVNDNLAARQLQGHTGKLIKCTTCHEPTAGGLPLNLNGPHGMHPVADFNGPDSRWNWAYGEYAEHNGTTACQACHGADGRGTALSRTAAARRLRCDDRNGRLCTGPSPWIDVPAGTVIGCDSCHANRIHGGDGAGDDD